MKILHISPSYFSADSVIGGGERYAYELARAMSNSQETVFLSFSEKPFEPQRGSLKEVYLSSLKSPRFFKWLQWADIIHCHQIWFHHTDWALIYGKWLKKKRVFATDLGGFQPHCLNRYFPIHKSLDGVLFISHYAQKIFHQNHPNFPKVKNSIIDGGVDISRFTPDTQIKRTQRVLYAGRIVSHKGIEYLIEAVGNDLELDVIGNVYEADYFQFLQQKALGKKVRFHHKVPDAELIRHYQTAAAVVQPSVYKNYGNVEINYPELLGLVPLEAMACAAPTIVTDVASLPELIQNGETGFRVPPNNSAALRERIQWVLDHPDEAGKIGLAAAASVLSKYTWVKTVEKCLLAYTQHEPNGVPS